MTCGLLSTILVLLDAAPLHAQPSALSLKGRVIEAGLDDFGVADVRICIERTTRCTTSRGDGSFELSLPSRHEELTLVLTATDYEPARLSLPAEPRVEPLVVPLTWAGEEEVPTITVVAARSNPDTASTTRLSPRDISSAPHKNAEEILRQVPGLTLVQHGSEGKGHQFFLRGFDAIHGADLAINLDGIPLNEWSNIHAQGYLDLALILPEMIQEVVVTKGPFTLQQGAFAMAGSADYQTGVAPAELGWRASYTAGTTNRHRLFASYAPPSSNGEQFVGVEAMHDDGFGVNRAIDRATLNARYQILDLGSGGTLHVLGLGSMATFELPGTLRNDDILSNAVDFYGSYDPRSNGRSARAVVALDYAWQANAHALKIKSYAGYRKLELLENFTGFLLDPVHGDRRSQQQETISFGASARHEMRLGQALAIQSGVGVRGDTFSQQEHNVGRDLERISERRHLDGVQSIIHLLAGLSWFPIEALRLDVGARLDRVHVEATDFLDNQTTGGDTLLIASPRMSARWKASPMWKFFLACGRGFRPPEARAFSSFESPRVGLGEEVLRKGAPNTTTSQAAEFGTRWSPLSWFDVTLSAFATLIERESIFDHVSGINLELNGTRRLGGELVLSAAPLPWLEVSADLTLVDARFAESKNRVPFAPWLVSGVRLVATQARGFRSGIRVLTVAPRPLPHGARGATLLMTDLTLGYHFKRIHLDLEIENLLDQHLREGEYHYASRWSPEEPASQIPVIHTTAGPPRNARLTLGVFF